MNNNLSNRELNELGKGVVISYLKKHGITQIPEKVDIEGIANSLGLKVCYESIAEEDMRKIGFLADGKMSGGELRAEVLANYLRHERLPDCTFLPENALYQRTYGTLPEGGVIIQQSHKRSQAARSFAA